MGFRFKLFGNGIHIGVVRIIKTKYMNEEQIRDEARKAANRSQFMSNHIYDHKSYEDGFYEGMNQALRQYGVIGSVCPDCLMGRDEFEPEWKCPDCRRQTDL